MRALHIAINQCSMSIKGYNLDINKPICYTKKKKEALNGFLQQIMQVIEGG